MATSKPKIYIVFYSMYGHIKILADSVKAGVEEAGGEAHLFQVAETLPEEVLTKMHAPPKPNIPVITAAELADADGILFGIPTRYGTAPAQLKALFDATGQLWQTGKLVGKTAGVFFSTASQGGGQETTALSTIPFFTHHAMIYVPIGFTTPLLHNNDEAHGGSGYGAGTLANGDGSRMPSELELGVAKHQGSYFTGVTKALLIGRAASTA